MSAFANAGRSTLKGALSRASNAFERAQVAARDRDYDRVARSLGRVQNLASSAASSSRLSESSGEITPRNISNATIRPTQLRQDSSSSTASTGLRTYFSATQREIRNAASHTEERCVCFPEDAVLVEKSGNQFVEVEVAGYVFRTRPVNQATRTQRIFVSMAKSLAGLAKLPANAAAKVEAHKSSSDDASDDEQPFYDAGETAASDPKNATFARLLALGNLPPHATDEEINNALQDLELTDEPDSMSDTSSEPVISRSRGSSIDLGDATHAPSLPSRLRFSSVDPDQPVAHVLPHVPPPKKEKSAPPVLPSRNVVKPLTTASSDSIPITPPSSKPSSRASSPNRHTKREAGMGSATSNLNFDETDLSILHHNLTDRLRAFFAQKLDGRRIRVSVYHVQSPEQSLLEAVCLAQGTITSGLGGAFKQVVTFPAVLRPSGLHLEHATLRTVAELLPADEDATPSNADGRKDTSLLRVTSHSIPRLISDIDDTCKHSEVLHGIRSVFRNVFTLPYDRVMVDGMADWYRAMVDHGCAIHYVSNGPVELADVIKQFMESAGLPTGQIKLKEYAGGSQMISNVWEPAGQRKRANLVDVLQRFPNSKFLLVGDSGEQDLEIYSTLAAEFTKQIVAIFIRDVTTPKSMAIKRRPSLKRLVSDQASKLGRPIVKRTSSSSLKSTSSSPVQTAHIPPPRQYTEPDTDFLSPNNPISVVDASTTKLVANFYKRIAHAESVIPKNVILRIFRSGAECQEEALRIVEQMSSDSDHAA